MTVFIRNGIQGRENHFATLISMKPTVLFLLVCCLGVAGCNVGMAPEGPTGAALKAKFDSLPIDKKIQLIQSGPGSAADKEKRIADLKAQGGK